MNTRDIAILNSLVTYAAENIPGGLKSNEQRVAQAVGAWVLDGVPVCRVCPHCLSVAPPFSDDELPWLPALWLQDHIDNPLHRMWWDMKKRLHRMRPR